MANIKFLKDVDITGGLTTTGDTGIGTSSPETKLDTNGVILARGGSWNGGGSEVNKNAAIVIEEGYQIYTRDNGTDLRNLIGKTSDYINIGHAGTTYVDGIRFYSGSSANYRWFHGNDENMRLDSTGLGIGTTSPLGKLQVNEYTVGSQGNQNVHGELSVFTDSGDESLFLGIRDAAYPNRGWAFNPVTNGVNSDLQIKEHGASGVRMTLQSAGNVGIGTTDPSQKLHVHGGNTRLSNSGDHVRLMLSTDNTDQAIIYFGDTDNEYKGRVAYANNGDYMYFTTNGSQRMTINSSGDVGIGTDGPTRDLDVRGGAIIAGSTPSAPIGTASTLEVYENGQDATLAIHQDNGASTTKFAQIRLRNGGNDTYIKTPTSGQALIVDTESLANAFVIETGGDVGIGTSSPSAKLEIETPQSTTGAFNAALLLSNNALTDNGGKTSIALATSTAVNYGYGISAERGASGADSDFIITHHDNSITGTERLRINSSGNVGIGKTSPTYKLDVNGGIQAGGKVTYTKSYSSLDTTGQDVAGIGTASNGKSNGFTFTCFGTGGYQKIVYSCINTNGTWSTNKVIDEGTNDFDIEASADGSTITFTFKSTSGTKNYSPKVLVEAIGSSIDNSYA